MSSRPKPTPNSALANAARLYQSGVSALDKGDYAQAVELLEQAAQQAGPAQVLSRHYLSQAHLSMGRQELFASHYDSAITHFNEARRHNPGSSDLGDLLVLGFAGKRQDELALSEIERTRQQHGDTVRRSIQTALLQWRTGRRPLAIETLEEAIKKYPDNADLPFQLALMQAELGHITTGRRLMQEATAMRPTFAQAYRHLGLMLALEGKFDHAAANLAEAHRMRPNDATVAREFATSLKACSSVIAEQLTAEFQNAPGAADTKAGFATHPDAAERLGAIFAGDPELVTTFLSLPVTPKDKEIFSLLARAADSAIKHRPTYADLHLYNGRLLKRLGLEEDAKASLDKAIELNPRFVSARIDRGKMLADKRRNEDALYDLTNAVELGGDYPDVHYRIGNIHREEGRFDQAQQSYSRALEINERYSDAREALVAVTANGK